VVRGLTPGNPFFGPRRSAGSPSPLLPLPHPLRQLHPPMDAKLPVDRVQVALDGRGAEPEFRGHLLVEATVGRQHGHLPLASRQRFVFFQQCDLPLPAPKRPCSYTTSRHTPSTIQRNAPADGSTPSPWSLVISH